MGTPASSTLVIGRVVLVLAVLAALAAGPASAGAFGSCWTHPPPARPADVSTVASGPLPTAVATWLGPAKSVAIRVSLFNLAADSFLMRVHREYAGNAETEIHVDGTTSHERCGVEVAPGSASFSLVEVLVKPTTSTWVRVELWGSP